MSGLSIHQGSSFTAFWIFETVSLNLRPPRKISLDGQILFTKNRILFRPKVLTNRELMFRFTVDQRMASRIATVLKPLHIYKRYTCQSISYIVHTCMHPQNNQCTCNASTSVLYVMCMHAGSGVVGLADWLMILIEFSWLVLGSLINCCCF